MAWKDHSLHRYANNFIPELFNFGRYDFCGIFERSLLEGRFLERSLLDGRDSGEASEKGNEELHDG